MLFCSNALASDYTASIFKLEGLETKEQTGCVFDGKLVSRPGRRVNKVLL